MKNLKNIFKVKKVFLILLAPLLMATQCDDDDTALNYQTGYFIQNDSSVDLILLTGTDQEIEIQSQTSLQFSDDFRATPIVVPPSENAVFNSINLSRLDDDDNLVGAYQQDPIVDDLWILDDSLTAFFQYTLIITDDLLD